MYGDEVVSYIGGVRGVWEGVCCWRKGVRGCKRVYGRVL